MREYRVRDLDHPGYFVLYSTKDGASDRMGRPRDIMTRKQMQSREEGIEGDDSTWTDEPWEAADIPW